MDRIVVEREVTGDIAALWAVTADVASWPRWDPHEEDARLDGPFEAGTTGWSKPHGAPAATWTLVDVVPGQAWTSTCPLPGGRIVGGLRLADRGAGRVLVTRWTEVTGPLVPLFRLWFGPRMRRDMVRTIAALEAEAARRAAVA